MKGRLIRGAALRKLREDALLTRPQFADLLGIDREYLRNLEGGWDQPSADLAIDIAKALRKKLRRPVSLDDFMDTIAEQAA